MLDYEYIGDVNGLWWWRRREHLIMMMLPKWISRVLVWHPKSFPSTKKKGKKSTFSSEFSQFSCLVLGPMASIAEMNWHLIANENHTKWEIIHFALVFFNDIQFADNVRRLLKHETSIINELSELIVRGREIRNLWMETKKMTCAIFDLISCVDDSWSLGTSDDGRFDI